MATRVIKTFIWYLQRLNRHPATCIEVYQTEQRIYRIINQVILVVGFMLMFAAGLWDYSSDE